MAYDIVRTDAFEADVLDTIDYLTEHLSSFQAAERLIARMDEAVDTLRKLPFLYSASGKPELSRLDCREVFIGGYSLVYCVEEDSVLLLRLIHQSQDPARIVIEWNEN